MVVSSSGSAQGAPEGFLAQDKTFNWSTNQPFSWFFVFDTNITS